MKFSPLDIQHMEFGSGLNGYNKNQVRNFLEKIAEQTEDLLREQQRLNDELFKRDRRVEELQSAELELKRAVIAAERIGNEMKQNAKREAQILLKEAEASRDEMMREAQARVKDLNGELARLERERDLFREQFRGMLQAFERSLDAAPKPARDGVRPHLAKAETT